MTAKIKLFNQGERHIHGLHLETVTEGGEAKKFTLSPKKAAVFSLETANKLRRLYPREILSMDDVVQQFDEKTADKPKVVTISLDEAEKVKQAAITAAVEAALTAERERVAAEQATAGDGEGEGEETTEETGDAAAPKRGRPAKDK